MRIFTALFSLCLISLSLSSCVTDGSSAFSALPATFTTGNIMQVHQGMSSDEILTMFGEPKDIAVSVCGRSPSQWTCTTWEYGDPPYDSARFTFAGKHNSLKLNDFNIDRD